MLIVIKIVQVITFARTQIERIKCTFDLSFEVPITLSLSSYTQNILQNQYITSNIQKDKINL